MHTSPNEKVFLARSLSASITANTKMLLKNIACSTQQCKTSLGKLKVTLSKVSYKLESKREIFIWDGLHFMDQVGVFLVDKQVTFNACRKWKHHTKVLTVSFQSKIQPAACDLAHRRRQNKTNALTWLTSPLLAFQLFFQKFQGRQLISQWRLRNFRNCMNSGLKTSKVTTEKKTPHHPGAKV